MGPAVDVITGGKVLYSRPHWDIRRTLRWHRRPLSLLYPQAVGIRGGRLVVSVPGTPGDVVDLYGRDGDVWDQAKQHWRGQRIGGLLIDTRPAFAALPRFGPTRPGLAAMQHACDDFEPPPRIRRAVRRHARPLTLLHPSGRLVVTAPGQPASLIDLHGHGDPWEQAKAVWRDRRIGGLLIDTRPGHTEATQ